MNHVYMDRTGVLHSCTGGQIHRNTVFLVWTLCDKDVPANASYKSWEEPTCIQCKQSEADQAVPFDKLVR